MYGKSTRFIDRNAFGACKMLKEHRKSKIIQNRSKSMDFVDHPVFQRTFHVMERESSVFTQNFVAVEL